MTASLQELLAEKTKALPEAILSKFQEYAESQILEHAFREGDVFPDFCLPDGEGRLISSVDLRQDRPLVVTFFRGGWCSYCNLTLRMIRDFLPQFKARGAAVVAISPMTVEQTQLMVQKASLNFPVLSDERSEFAQTLNIAYDLDEELRPYCQEIPSYNGTKDDWVLPLPATYVIGKDGRILYSFLEFDPTQRAEPSKVLAQLPPLDPNEHLKTLKDKLEYEMSVWREKVQEEAWKCMREEILVSRESRISAQALRVGATAPSFALKQLSNGKVIDSKKLLRQGPLVITFYYGDWSNLCMTALQEFQAHLTEIQGKGANLVAISPKSASGNLAIEKSGATFPLLFDENNQMARQFHLRYHMDCSFPGNDDPPWPLPMPATFVVDGDKIVYASISCDPSQRPELSSIVHAIPVSKRTGVRQRGPFSLRLKGWSPVKMLSSRRILNSTTTAAADS
jgi:peroxiredoxin